MRRKIRAGDPLVLGGAATLLVTALVSGAAWLARHVSADTFCGAVRGACDAVQAVTMVDGDDGIPSEPLPGQARPRPDGSCVDGYTAMKGGCWFPGERRPPKCPEGSYPARGKCWLPYVLPVPRVPNSVRAPRCSN